jgi:glycosyltransferase involved in cell wall biosynthesis
MKISLIVSTYNWPQALELCLLSALNQSVKPTEIVVADDGSKQETINLVEKFIKSSEIPIVHVWQEDNGFQLAQIRNKAFAKSIGDYIIQVDGDVILHHHFVKDHISLARKNCLIQGGRVVLGSKISEKIIAAKKIDISIFGNGIKRREEGIRLIPLSNFLSTRYRNKYPIYYARGANMSFWKADLLKINGYNEDFSGWGHEDSDLTARMLNAGSTKLILKFGGIVYHLYHREHHSKENDAQNEKLLKQTVEAKLIYIPKGIDQYLK